MRSGTLAAFLALVLCATAHAQSGKPAGATIGGRVHDGDTAVDDAVVFVFRADPGENVPVARARTGSDGGYTVEGVPPGSYRVQAVAPGLYADDDDFGRFGAAVTVGEGDRVKGIDLTLRRGGVVTGRVTDADGRPVVNETIDGS